MRSFSLRVESEAWCEIERKKVFFLEKEKEIN